MASNDIKILLTGATGYIGGTVLADLIASTHPRLRSAQISLLLRDEDGSRGAALTREYGKRVAPVPFADLGDSAHVEEVAAQHDIVINTALGFHPTFGASLARGLAKRKSPAGAPAPLLIHTSGTSNLADQPLTGTAHPEREFDDAKGAETYEWEVRAESETPYHQRTAELNTIKAGLENGVKTLVIMSPTIYGVGTGLFNKTSIQIPLVTNQMIKSGEGIVIGDGAGVWDNVHVEDLGSLYTLVVASYLEDPSKLPTGKAGIMFSGTRRHTWKEFFQSIADALHSKGRLQSSNLNKISPAQGAEYFGFDAASVEAGWASNSKTVASIAKGLGFRPKHGADSWKRGFEEEVDKALEKENKA